MAHRLDGARLKVIRAQEHLKSFNEEARRYVGAEPYEVVTECEGDVIGYKVIVTAEPPPSLACIIGDFVTNLRASLDYVAWELAMLAGRPLTDPQERKITFPIAPDNASFTKQNGTADHLQRICGVPTAAIDIIKSVQPYNTGYEPLLVLDKLVRMDKHRMLWLCAGLIETAGTICIYRGNEPVERFDECTRVSINLAAHLPPRGPASDYRVEMQEKPTLFVSIKDFPPPGEPTNVILEQILKCVANIIPRFDHFF